MKLEAAFADVCLPSYWGGHHLPHLSVHVWKGMTLDELKQQLKNELHEGCVLGAEAPEEDDEAWFEDAIHAVNNIETKEGVTTLFNDLEDEDEDDCGCCELVQAYFVFIVAESDEEEEE